MEKREKMSLNLSAPEQYIVHNFVCINSNVFAFAFKKTTEHTPSAIQPLYTLVVHFFLRLLFLQERSVFGRRLGVGFVHFSRLLQSFFFFTFSPFNKEIKHNKQKLWTKAKKKKDKRMYEGKKTEAGCVSEIHRRIFQIIKTINWRFSWFLLYSDSSSSLQRKAKTDKTVSNEISHFNNLKPTNLSLCAYKFCYFRSFVFIEETCFEIWKNFVGRERKISYEGTIMGVETSSILEEVGYGSLMKEKRSYDREHGIGLGNNERSCSCIFLWF